MFKRILLTSIALVDFFLASAIFLSSNYDNISDLIFAFDFLTIVTRHTLARSSICDTFPFDTKIKHKIRCTAHAGEISSYHVIAEL